MKSSETLRNVVNNQSDFKAIKLVAGFDVGARVSEHPGSLTKYGRQEGCGCCATTRHLIRNGWNNIYFFAAIKQVAGFYSGSRGSEHPARRLVFRLFGACPNVRQNLGEMVIMSPHSHGRSGFWYRLFWYFSIAFVQYAFSMRRNMLPIVDIFRP